METYTYKFEFSGLIYWVYDVSLVEAKKKFQEETNIDPERKDIVISRVEPGNSHKPDFNDPFA